MDLTYFGQFKFHFLWNFLIFATVSVQTATGLNCYQCLDCKEGVQMAKEKCVGMAQKCITKFVYKGLVEVPDQLDSTIRLCDDFPMGCNKVRIPSQTPGQDYIMIICACTDTDFCNKSNKLYLSTYISSGFIIYLLFCFIS